eukprot:TRINITY_DN706_c0_g2_i1.p1 TRINITY_DN706_c0_g2~~TRINITY_DN706_c0_g2_i1.p1  ORF type:complete len:418 (-),score=56.53 TRINITY_DN706_c0_g2_i1:31-1284(-)
MCIRDRYQRRVRAKIHGTTQLAPVELEGEGEAFYVGIPGLRTDPIPRAQGEDANKMALQNIQATAEYSKARHDNSTPFTVYHVGEIVRVRARRQVRKKGKSGEFAWIAKIVSRESQTAYKLQWLGTAQNWRVAPPNSQGGPNTTDLVGTRTSTGWSNAHLKKYPCSENEQLMQSLHEQEGTTETEDDDDVVLTSVGPMFQAHQPLLQPSVPTSRTTATSTTTTTTTTSTTTTTATAMPSYQLPIAQQMAIFENMKQDLQQRLLEDLFRQVMEKISSSQTSNSFVFSENAPIPSFPSQFASSLPVFRSPSPTQAADSYIRSPSPPPNNHHESSDSLTSIRSPTPPLSRSNRRSQANKGNLTSNRAASQRIARKMAHETNRVEADKISESAWYRNLGTGETTVASSRRRSEPDRWIDHM